MWEVLDTGVALAKKNMAIDAELLASLAERRRPLLHFYEWEGSAVTYGMLVRPEQFLNVDKAEELGICLAKRPTGGGIIFHMWDFAFSALVPKRSPLFSQNTLQNYALINRAVLEAVHAFVQGGHIGALMNEDAPLAGEASRRFCMARPTKYDVVMEGKKVAGAAQRKTKEGFLHQGSIALCMPDPSLLKALLLDASTLIEAMLSKTYPLLGEGASMQSAKKELKTLLIHALNKESS